MNLFVAAGIAVVCCGGVLGCHGGKLVHGISFVCESFFVTNEERFEFGHVYLPHERRIHYVASRACLLPVIFVVVCPPRLHCVAAALLC